MTIMSSILVSTSLTSVVLDGVSLKLEASLPPEASHLQDADLNDGPGGGGEAGGPHPLHSI